MRALMGLQQKPRDASGVVSRWRYIRQGEGEGLSGPTACPLRRWRRELTVVSHRGGTTDVYFCGVAKFQTYHVIAFYSILLWFGDTRRTLTRVRKVIRRVCDDSPQTKGSLYTNPYPTPRRGIAEVMSQGKERMSSK